jgi:hypothetical protein
MAMARRIAAQRAGQREELAPTTARRVVHSRTRGE